MMRKGKGFTIVELLVVLAVIGILAAVLIPVFQGVTEQARRAGREAALASVNKALALYVAGHGEEPLKLEGELCGANILHAVQSELGPEVLPELRPEEEFLAYEKESGRVKLFESPPAGYAEADRPNLILPGLVLLDAELLSSFYDPVLSGGSFGAFLDYVKTCPRSYSGELQKYAAGRVFVGSREGKSEVLTVNGGKDLRPVFAKREDALPAAFYDHVTAETAIGCGQPHEAAQLYRLAQEKQELLEYGISGAGLKVGECTLSALISAWRVESFTIDPEDRTVTLSDEHGVLTFAPSDSDEGGSEIEDPNVGGEGSGTDTGSGPDIGGSEIEDPNVGGEEPGADTGSGSDTSGSETGEPDEGGEGSGELGEAVELKVWIIKKLWKTGAPKNKEVVELYLQKAGEEEAIMLKEVTLSEEEQKVCIDLSQTEIRPAYGDILLARLKAATHYFSQGGWYVPAGLTYGVTKEDGGTEQREFFRQRGLGGYSITEGEKEVQLWLVPVFKTYDLTSFDSVSSFIPDLTDHPEVLVSFDCGEGDQQRFFFMMDGSLKLIQFGKRTVRVDSESAIYTLKEISTEDGLVLYELIVNLNGMFQYQNKDGQTELFYDDADQDLYHIAKILIEKGSG